MCEVAKKCTQEGESSDDEGIQRLGKSQHKLLARQVCLCPLDAMRVKYCRFEAPAAAISVVRKTSGKLVVARDVGECMPTRDEVEVTPRRR